MVSRRAVLSGRVVLGCAPSAWSAPRDGRVSPASILRRAVHCSQVPGVVALIADRPGVVRADVAGFSDIDAGRSMRRGTLFRIASMRQPITARLRSVGSGRGLSQKPAPSACGWDGPYRTKLTDDPAKGVAEVSFMQVTGGHYALQLAKDHVRAAYQCLSW